MKIIARHSKNHFSLDGKLVPKIYSAKNIKNNIVLVNVYNNNWGYSFELSDVTADSKVLSDFSSITEFINFINELVFEKGGADGEGSGNGTTAAISWTDINGKPTIQLTETIVFNNSLNSADQDTNDEEYIYKWSDTNNPVDITLSNDGSTLTANKKGTYHINPFIRITDAKANLRSSFYLELDVIGTDGSVAYVLKSSASFIQDDNNAIDKFSVANDFSVVLDVDQKIRLRSIRLFSQDRNDANYANMNLSTLLIRRIDYTLQ